MTLSTSIEDEPNSDHPAFRVRFTSSACDQRVVDHSAMQLKRNISIALTQDELKQLREQVDEAINE